MDKIQNELKEVQKKLDDISKKQEMMNKLSFADELEKGPLQNSEDNTIIVAIVAGIVIAGIIGGVIFKLKKN